VKTMPKSLIAAR